MTSPLALLAAFLLAAGSLLALLIPPEPVATPLFAAAPLVLLALGVLAASVHALLRREAAAGFGSLLLALLFLVPALPPVRGHLPLAATLAILVLAAAAWRSMRLQGAAFTLLLAGLALTAVLGISQWWHQLDAAEDFALRQTLDIAETARGRAFLASNRATGTSLVANTFAATLLLALPFLALAAMRARTRVLPCFFLLGIGGAFVAAGSAGATLAGLAATALCCWHAERPWRRVARSAALLLALAIALMLVSATWSAVPEWLALKSASLGERADFQTLALRLFEPAHLLQGTGWMNFAPLAESVILPGESWSSSPHSVPLQLALEGGVVLAAAALVAGWWALRSMKNGAADAIASIPPAALLALRRDRAPLAARDPVSSAVLYGGLLAAILAPLCVPMLSPLPLDFDHPFLAAALMGLLFLGASRGAAALVCMSMGRGALAVGVVAFLVHGLVDSDLFIPSAAAALCLALAAGLPTTSPSRGRAALSALAAIVIACALVSHLATAAAWRVAESDAEGTGEPALLRTAMEAAEKHAAATGALEAFESAGPLFALRGQRGINDLRSALPAHLHSVPRTALLITRIAEAALRDARMTAAEALACCEPFVHADSPRRALILANASRIAAAAGANALADSWRASATESARHWGLKPP